MSAADDFARLFDEQGRYKNGDGEVAVVFLTKSGAQHPGKLRFKSGLEVSAEMGGATSWGCYPDESALGGLKLQLQFQGEKPRTVFVEQGRVVHNFVLQDRASKEKFLANFRVARNLFAHAKAEADSPAIDTASITDALTRGALWLTPKSVEDFDAADFPELKPDRQAELLKAMLLTSFKVVVGLLLALGVLAVGVGGFPPALPVAAQARAEAKERLPTPAELDSLAAAIKPTAQESKWQQIPWITDVNEGRRLAKVEKRPLLLWTIFGEPLDEC